MNPEITITEGFVLYCAVVHRRRHMEAVMHQLFTTSSMSQFARQEGTAMGRKNLMAPFSGAAHFKTETFLTSLP